MALMFNPEPMPVEVIRELAAPEEAPVEEAAETAELMNETSAAHAGIIGIHRMNLSKTRTRPAGGAAPDPAALQACSSIRALEIPRLLASAGKAITG